MASSNKRDLWKPIQLLAQVIIFSVSKYALICLMKSNFNIRGLVGALIPANYFVILYIVVFIISPYINLIFDYVEKAQAAFQEYKDKQHLIDFTDMEVRFLELLDKKEISLSY